MRCMAPKTPVLIAIHDKDSREALGAPEVPIHDVLLNDAPVRSDQVVNSARYGAFPIGYDTEALEALGCSVP
jgi:hypothetical protein